MNEDKQLPGIDRFDHRFNSENLRTLVVIAEDKHGVIQRVVNVIGRRGFGVRHLSINHSNYVNEIIINLTLDIGTQMNDQATKQLSKLIDVIFVEDVTDKIKNRRGYSLIKIDDHGFENISESVKNMVDLHVLQTLNEFKVLIISGSRQKIALFLQQLPTDAIWTSSGLLTMRDFGDIELSQQDEFTILS